MAQVAEKTFQDFLQLVPKVRAMVFDEMDVVDRVRMTRCSKVCNEEAKASKNYVYGMEIVCSSAATTIRFTFGERFSRQGFVLQFEEESGKKLRTCQDRGHNKLWEEEMDNSTDLLKYGLEEFEKRLSTFQNSIKMLRISELYQDDERPEMLRNIGCGIEKLRNLERLQIDGSFDVQQVLAKLRLPLKKFEITRNKEDLPEQVYQIGQLLSLDNKEIDNAQFLRLSTRSLQMPIGRLNEKDILRFIKSWQDGTIGKEVEYYEWTLCGSKFSSRKLRRLLRDQFSEKNRFAKIEIRSFIEPWKSAELTVSDVSVQFSTTQTQGFDI